jgi:hypothetical protein
MYNYYLNNFNAVNAGVSVRREQPNTQLGTVLTQRHQTAANTNPVDSGSLECPCSIAVSENAGGNMSKNVQ